LLARTAQAIAEAAILKSNHHLAVGLEEHIRDEYLHELKKVHAADPLAFPARPGALTAAGAGA